MPFGRMIKSGRTRLGLTQRELGDRIGCTDGYVAHLEREVKVPSVSICMALADVFGLSAQQQHEFLSAVDDARAKRSKRRILVRGAAVRDLLRSRDGVAPARHTLGLYDVTSGKTTRDFAADGAAIQVLALTPASDRTALGHTDGSIVVVDTTAGTRQQLTTESNVSALAFSAGGRLLAGGVGNEVRVWDVESAEQLVTLGPHDGDVTTVSFAPDGDVVVSGASDGSVRLWSPTNEKLLMDLEAHPSDVTAVVFSPNGKTLATAARDGTVALWDSQSGARSHDLRGHASAVQCTAFSSDGALLTTGGVDRTARLWDVSTGAELRSLPGHRHAVAAAAFKPDGVTLTTVSTDGVIKTWDTRSGVERQSVSLESGAFQQCVLSREADVVLVLGGSADEHEPLGPERIARDLLNNPQLAEAYPALVQALEDPAMRDTVLNTLKAFAKSASRAANQA